MEKLVSEKKILSFNPFYSRRDVLLALAAFVVIVSVVRLFSFFLDSSDWDLDGGAAGASAAIIVVMARLIPISGRAKRSMRDMVIDRLGSLNYILESRDQEGNLHFRRKGNILTRWDSERATIFVNSAAYDLVVAPFSVMHTL